MRQQSEHGRPAEPSKPTREDYSSDSDQNESNPFGSHDAGRSIELESPKPNTSANGPATDLRSELAGLFGLQKTIQSSPQSEDLDLSEPTGENMSVMFNFGTDAQTLVEAESERLLQEGAQPAREENSDDFVCQYMEELLTRSRQTAGSVLPGELKAAEKKSEPAAASAAKSVEPPVKKSGPKVKSFIEQYMAGNMGDLDNPKSLEVSDSGSESCGTAADTESRPVLPRQKMDLQKLKENMASFRTLSTQSVENALASHALRVERHGFTGRTGFAIVLLTMTLVLGIANAKGVIDYPMLTWVTLTSAIGILNELHRRYASIKIHTRSPLDLLFSSDPPRESADMMAAAPIPAVECSSRNDDSTIDDDCVEPVEESNPSETALVETHVS
jgi:hypothetical protein